MVSARTVTRHASGALRHLVHQLITQQTSFIHRLRGFLVATGARGVTDRRRYRDGVRAGAGGVVWRLGRRARPEVLLVHPRRHDDWTLPWTAVSDGARAKQAAVDHVLRLGALCLADTATATTTYRGRNGSDPTVQFWLMRFLSGEFTPTAHVDEAWWLPVDVVPSVASHRQDAIIVRTLCASLATPPFSSRR